jgi:hypothetical protein
VTIEEMRQASIAVMSVVPTWPGGSAKSRDAGRDERGRDRTSDDESVVTVSP